MVVSRIDRLLARTDPFDLSQAVERHVRSLSGDRIRALLRAAGPRLGAYYRDEFARLTGSGDFETALTSARSDAVLRSAFVKFLTSNLRAIPIFGSSFGLALLEHTPLDRAVGIGEEHPNRLARGAMVGGAALALVIAGAAGEHAIVGARASLQSPPPAVVLPPAAVTTPHPAGSAVAPATRAPSPKPGVVARVTTSSIATPLPEAVETVPPDRPTPVPAPTPVRTLKPPPNGAGVAEVTAPPETPTPEPTEIDVSDMPEAYSDATPLPQQTPVAAQVPRAIHVPTPKPSPKKRSWIRRTLDHLNPFKP